VRGARPHHRTHEPHAACEWLLLLPLFAAPEPLTLRFRATVPSADRWQTRCEKSLPRATFCCS
jgi:hypothetical protein